MVETHSAGPLDLREVSDGRVPHDPAEAAEWLRADGTRLTESVCAAPDATAWTFLGPRPASWWVRRRLHEVTVHRADAALARGTAYDVEPEVAADGVDEWLGLIAARRPDTDETVALDPGALLELSPEDAEAVWRLRGTDAGIEVSSGPSDSGPRPDAVVAGRAADLLLALSRRADRVTVSGDQAVWGQWLERTPF